MELESRKNRDEKDAQEREAKAAHNDEIIDGGKRSVAVEAPTGSCPTFKSNCYGNVGNR